MTVIEIDPPRPWIGPLEPRDLHRVGDHDDLGVVWQGDVHDPHEGSAGDGDSLGVGVGVEAGRVEKLIIVWRPRPLAGVARRGRNDRR